MQPFNYIPPFQTIIIHVNLSSNSPSNMIKNSMSGFADSRFSESRLHTKTVIIMNGVALCVMKSGWGRQYGHWTNQQHPVAEQKRKMSWMECTQTNLHIYTGSCLTSRYLYCANAAVRRRLSLNGIYYVIMFSVCWNLHCSFRLEY